MSYEKLGFVSGQKLKAEHLNHIEDGIANTSWNDLADKPFYEEVTEAMGDTLSWDGSTDGKLFIDLGEGYGFAKIGDNILAPEDVANGIAIGMVDVDGTIDEVPMTGEEAQNMFADSFAVFTGAIVAVLNDNTEADGLVFPEKGIYFNRMPNGERVAYLRVNGYAGFATTTTVVKPLDEKYLPDSVKGGGGGKTLIISTEDMTTFTVNMKLAEALTAFSKRELVGAVLYMPGDDGAFAMYNLIVGDVSAVVGAECIMCAELILEMEFFWTAAGISTKSPV